MTRVEDGPLLRGLGRFVDDLDMQGALHVAFLRSPVAHGRLNGIDASAAKALPGVHAVLTFADLRPLLTRYIVVHDSGRIINPMIVDGQVMGAVAHGIGATLYEWMRFDEQGQPLTVTYGDYLVAEHRHRAADRSGSVAPRDRPGNPAGPWVRDPHGVADAAQSVSRARPKAAPLRRRPRSSRAIEDALRPLGVRIRDLPLTPERLLTLIRPAG